MRYSLYLLVFIALFSCKVKQISDYSGTNYPMGDTTFVSHDLDSLVLPYKVEMDSKMDKVIGFSEHALTNYAPESPLGNFVADVVYQAGYSYATKNQLELTQINSMCLINFGGLRAPINAGDITIGHIYELMPFDNEIVIVKLQPTHVKLMLTYLFKKHGQPLSNAKALLASDKNRLDIGGVPYDFDKDLYVITSDYLAKGGDKMDFLTSSKMIQTGVLMRDALLTYVQKVNKIPSFSVEDRIQFIKQ